MDEEIMQHIKDILTELAVLFCRKQYLQYLDELALAESREFMD